MIRVGARQFSRAALVAGALLSGRWLEETSAFSAQPQPPQAGLPTLIQGAPYGDPFVVFAPRQAWEPIPISLRPANTGSLGSTESGRAGLQRPRQEAVSASGGGSTKTSEDDDDDDAPRTPGTFGHDYVKVPDAVPPLRRSRQSLGPHLTPDFNFEVMERTSIGLFGQADRLETNFGPSRGPARNAASAIFAIRPKDLGGGVTLQFNFGK